MSDIKQKVILTIAGPTASGKTRLAIALANRFDGEILSADSMQIYRGMEIGTAAPTAEERRAAPHHGIGILPLNETFSVAQWREYAVTCIDEIISRRHFPILCGGTGLYLDAIFKINTYAEQICDETLRTELNNYAAIHGAEALHQMLVSLDPETATQIHPNNIKRVVRAIEICRTTGKTKTENDRLQRMNEKSPYLECRILLEFHNRDILYERINRRVDQMLADGLVAEAKKALENQSRTAMQAIGYKELIPYFDGTISLDEAAEQIRKSSRNYAKRQITWFRRSSGHRLFCDTEAGEMRSKEEIISEAAAVFEKFCSL